MSAHALESERLTLLPTRLETRRLRPAGGNNWAQVIQINWGSQSMGACVSNCTQVINQYNFVFVFQW